MKDNVVYPQSSGTNNYVGYYRHTSEIIYFVEKVDFRSIRFLWWNEKDGTRELSYSPNIVVSFSVSHTGFLRSINSAFRKFFGRYILDRSHFVRN